MEKNINIIKTKANNLEFDLEIEGVDANDEKVNFVIEAKEYDFSIPCKKLNNKRWSVTIPEMDSLETTLYKFHIDVITSGYHFMPYEGTLNVIKSAELYVKNIENKTAKSTATEKTKSSTTEKTKVEKPEEEEVSKSQDKKPDTEFSLFKNQVNKGEEKKKPTKKVEAPKAVKKEIDKIASDIVKDSIKKDSKAKAPAPKKVKSEINKLANEITKEVNKKKNKPLFKKVDEPKVVKSEIAKIADEIVSKDDSKKGGFKISKIDEKVLDILNSDTAQKPTVSSVKFKKGSIAEI